MALQLRLPADGPREVADALRVLLEELEEPLPAEQVKHVVDAALGVCRGLYGGARSGEALPLARAVLAQCQLSGDRTQTRRSAVLCGLLAGDTADLVGAIEYHVQALRLAAADEDRAEMSRTWGNIGLALGISGNYGMAERCYRRALALAEIDPEPLYGRFSACANLADCLYQAGKFEEGVEFGERALLELTPEFRDHDPYAAILLRRNFVRLLLATGQVADAGIHVAEAVALAQRFPSPRASIAADIARASVELASGRTDFALTRLDRTLTRAREVPAALHDTLACVIRAEESAGHTARALMRLEELSDHVYKSGVVRIRQHLELAGLDAGPWSQPHHEQARARLIAQLAPPTQPEGWKALQRLAVGAVLRMDETGWHGMRVGALTKALAMASGVGPLQALEMGFAAEVHDIGMMSVPAALLAKPGRINDAERAIIERHAEAGAEMLRDDRHPRVFLAREISKYHHARWDGEGYPERVGGTLIPLGARICAIADAYDAMVCGLGARSPRSMGDALEELRREAGGQFDPELVSCFDTLVKGEMEGLGLDPAADAGMGDFQNLVTSLKEDRGFV